MMSNGPCSSRLSFQSGTRSTVAASDLLGRLQHEDVPEALLPQPAERPPQLRLLVADDVGAEVPVGPQPVPFLADSLGKVEHDGHRQAVVLPGQLDQRLAGLGLDVGGVDDRQPAQGQPLAGDEVEHLEGVVGDGLVVLVVADHRPAGVGREDLGGRKCLRANVLLPEPLGPIRTTRESLGIVMCISVTPFRDEGRCRLTSSKSRPDLMAFGRISRAF